MTKYRGFYIDVEQGLSSYKITRASKGPLPKILSGGWTSFGKAKKAIDQYQQSIDKKISK